VNLSLHRLVMSELQKLFARLLYTNQKYVDPSDLLKKLKDKNGKTIEIGQQEDVGGKKRISGTYN
jgi:hypothetical protein